jgi:hypothetical protein
MARRAPTDGHTLCHLGIEVDDEIEIAEKINV